MLYLNRKPGEAVIINHCIEVRVVRRPVGRRRRGPGPRVR
jgi:sRNA-binding carbon storage regulator CsrA